MSTESKIEVTKEDRIKNSLLRIESSIYHQIAGMPKALFKIELSEFEFVIFNKTGFNINIITCLKGIDDNILTFNSISDLMNYMVDYYLSLSNDKIENHFAAWQSNIIVEDNGEEYKLKDLDWETKQNKKEIDRDILGYEKISRVKENTTT
jgi:hypothetical protein